MGVTGLNKFLKDKYPDVYTYDHISKFAFKNFEKVFLYKISCLF